MSGIPEHFGCSLCKHLQRALPDRTVQHTGLTEAAATNAAALNFQHYTILGDLNKWNQRLLRIKGMGQIRNHLLLNLCRRMGIVGLHGRKGSVLVIRHIIERRHIDSRDFRRTLQELYTALSCRFGSLERVQKGKIGGFSLTDVLARGSGL